MKRVYIVNAIGYVCIMAAILCGIGMIGSVGAMEWGAPMGRCMLQGIGCTIAAYVLGKIGTELAMI